MQNYWINDVVGLMLLRNFYTMVEAVAKDSQVMEEFWIVKVLG